MSLLCLRRFGGRGGRAMPQLGTAPDGRACPAPTGRRHRLCGLRRDEAVKRFVARSVRFTRVGVRWAVCVGVGGTMRSVRRAQLVRWALVLGCSVYYAEGLMCRGLSVRGLVLQRVLRVPPAEGVCRGRSARRAEGVCRGPGARLAECVCRGPGVRRVEGVCRGPGARRAECVCRGPGARRVEGVCRGPGVRRAEGVGRGPGARRAEGVGRGPGARRAECVSLGQPYEVSNFPETPGDLNFPPFFHSGDRRLNFCKEKCRFSAIFPTIFPPFFPERPVFHPFFHPFFQPF